MRINTNIASLQTQTQMQRTSKALQRALERLSSGQRINSARDNASGLARSVGLDADVRGLNRALLNMNEAQGMLQTAEGALQTQMDLVQRMRELAVQAANDTLTANDRANLDQEIQSLMAEFNRLTQETHFNGSKLLDGSFGSRNIQVGSQKNQTIEIELGSTSADEIFTKTVGTGNFSDRTVLSSLDGPRVSTVADLNGDGNLDLVVGAGSIVQIYDGQGDGTFAAVRTFDFGYALAGLEAGDVTGDGVIDLVAVSSAAINTRLLVGTGDGNFQAFESLNSNSNLLNALNLSDLNNDGLLDIIVSETGSATGLGVHLSNGDGTFRAYVELPSPGSFSIVARIETADINGDGYLDILTANSTANSVSMYLGTGSGTSFTIQTLSLAAGSEPRGLALWDMDSDGDLDMAVSNRLTNTVLIYSNNGSGTYSVSSTLSLALGSGPRDLKAEDVDGDGRRDLLVLNEDARNLAVFLATGAGTFGQAKTFGLGGGGTNGAWNFETGDFNNDGYLDVMVPELGSAAGVAAGNEVSVLLGLTEVVSAENDIRLTTSTLAANALSLLDQAIERISNQRANIGALQNRLEYAQSVTAQTKENLASARSQIMDADLAEETAELTRLQILQQAQAAVLGQSNVSLRIALQLLSF